MGPTTSPCDPHLAPPLTASAVLTSRLKRGVRYLPVSASISTSAGNSLVTDPAQRVHGASVGR